MKLSPSVCLEAICAEQRRDGSSPRMANRSYLEMVVSVGFSITSPSLSPASYLSSWYLWKCSVDREVSGTVLGLKRVSHVPHSVTHSKNIPPPSNPRQPHVLDPQNFYNVFNECCWYTRHPSLISTAPPTNAVSHSTANVNIYVLYIRRARRQINIIYGTIFSMESFVQKLKMVEISVSAFRLAVVHRICFHNLRYLRFAQWEKSVFRGWRGCEWNNGRGRRDKAGVYGFVFWESVCRIQFMLWWYTTTAPSSDLL